MRTARKALTLGSLFDGIGGFCLASQQAGITPVWVAEIEPFPLLVTERRFPDVIQLGDVCAINGADIPAVDIVSFGSPCQNLSMAGNRKGLSGEQSSLFFEAIRIIKEMRSESNGKQPRWVVFENVPGALSANNGHDFQSILQSLVSIADRQAVIPMPETGKWIGAGEIMGDHYSLAWRILDAAKGWGVPQRRRRIFAVLDLDGSSAGQILFESEGLSRYSPPHTAKRKKIAGSSDKSFAAASGGIVLNDQGGNAIGITHEQTATLRAQMHAHLPLILNHQHRDVHTLSFSMGLFSYAEDIAPTLMAHDAKGPPVVHADDGLAVRRLTPDECCRLQGYPDGWCRNLEIRHPTNQEILHWKHIYETWDTVQGRILPRTEKQIIKWLQNPNTDAAEYKAYGNSVAVPCVFFVLAGIVWAAGKEKYHEIE